MMKKWIVVGMLLALPVLTLGQVSTSEMTFSGAKQGSATGQYGRLRLQNGRGFPVYELYSTNNASDVRMGMLRPVGKSFHIKGVFTYLDPGFVSRAGHVSAIYHQKNFGAVAGVDFRNGGGADSQENISLRLKYKMKSITLFGGASGSYQSNFLGGVSFDLPSQFYLNGMVASVDDAEDVMIQDDRETGFAVNVGRYNKPGDFAGLPSFSLNHIDIPDTYQWTNFRVMWGDQGGHYVRPTFDNPVFAGQVDVNSALLLGELVPFNYRHFDSPLLFRRYDEYGTVALRVNRLNLENGITKTDVNVNYNSGLNAWVFENVGVVLTRAETVIENPMMGSDQHRYAGTLVATALKNIYVGVTYNSDFDTHDSDELRIELRTFGLLQF